MDNKALRKQALQARRALSEEQRWRFSKQICELVYPLLKDAQHIALYMASEEEVDLSFLLLPLLKEKNVYVPVCQADGIMDLCRLYGDSRMKENTYGILEPEVQEAIDPALIEVILVPMVAYDAQGHRLGHGMGYYDRYLAKSSALRIGVAFSCQKVDQIDAQPHDQAMDHIVDENQIYSF